MLINCVLVRNSQQKLVISSCVGCVNLLYGSIVFLNFLYKMIFLHYILVFIKVCCNSFQSLDNFLLLLVGLIIEVTFISNLFSLLSDFLDVIPICLYIFLILCKLSIDACVFSINKRGFFGDLCHNIVMRQVVEVIDNCFLISYELWDQGCVHFVVTNELLVVRFNCEVLVFLDGSLTNHVNSFAGKSAFIILCVNFLVVMEMIRVLKPNLMNDMLIWDPDTSMSRHKHIDIVILGKIVLWNRDSKTRFQVFFLSIGIQEWNNEFIVLSMNKKGLVLKVNIASTLRGII